MSLLKLVTSSFFVTAWLLGCAPAPEPGDASLDLVNRHTDSSADTEVATDTAEPTDTATEVSADTGIDESSSCLVEGGALSTCLVPHQAPEYYVDQALKYFDTLDATADPNSVPRYSALVARWEWPPWLKLTGYGRQMMTSIDKLLVIVTPSTVPWRDCRAFSTQPFARCRVSFDYDGRGCPIYEEFTFNDEGEMTFIEAWSDAPGLLPMLDEADLWGEGPSVHRLSTALPGLGDAHGRLSLNAAWMKQAASRDPEIADFVRRAKRFWPTWIKEYLSAGPDLFERGCGW